MTELRIPLSSPDVDEDDVSAVAGVLRSSRLSLGPVLGEFERRFAEYTGAPHAVAVSSGTAGLHLALLALDIGAGDEVIVPAFTFIAAANAVRYVGAVPVFADIDPVTLNMEPACVERAVTARTRAIMVVHTFGVPAEIDALLAIARRHGLKIVEDACEAIGAEYKGRKVGAFGDAGVFGFYPNKQMTTGEGGMVVMTENGLAEAVRSLRNHGRRPTDEWFEHSDLGYNYRLSEMNCALGISQLERIAAILARRAVIAQEYRHRLSRCRELVLPPPSLPYRTVSWFVYVVRLNHKFTAAHRDAVRSRLRGRGIACGRYFAPIHLQSAYRSVASAQVYLPVTESEAERTLALPFFNRITSDQVEDVCDELLKALERL